MYRYDQYYNDYLLTVMREEELNSNSSLVELLKNGNRRVSKRVLKEKYGADKLAVINETIKRPEILKKYKKDMEIKASLPLNQIDISSIEKNMDVPNWKELQDELNDLQPGQDNASKYENLIEKIITSLFYPSLCFPAKQTEIHDGRKRIDITYTNAARDGFFHWLLTHYTCPLIFVECKNYGAEIGNPEIDQLAGRFSHSRGWVGFLICRKIQNRKLLLSRCRDTVNDNRGYIIPLDDADIKQIITEKIINHESNEFKPLREIFLKLIN